MENRRNWELLIADWNGTFLKDLKVAHGSANNIFSHYGASVLPTLDDFKAGIALNYMEFYRRWGVPEDATSEDLNKIRREYFEKHEDLLSLNRGVPEFIMLCRSFGLKIAIVSGEDPKILQRCVARFLPGELAPDYAFGGVSNKELVFQIIMDEERARPSETLSVGDTAGDIFTAKQLEIFSIAILGGYNTKEKVLSAKPDFVISSFEEASVLFA